MKHVMLVFADEKKGSNLLVWLVSEPCRRIPLDILHDVYVLSWHSLISLTSDGSTEAANQPSPYCSMDQALANGQCQFCNLLHDGDTFSDLDISLYRLVQVE